MKKNEPKDIYGCELKRGKYYLRVFVTFTTILK